ncbi:MAG: TRAP transporter small permease [Chromatiales bacterium]|jgi:TRAP-type C4-dicarboxylate transport system permease small subunit|nr:TRAP transporter small permease [Chromatiales bacterium]
MLRFLIAFDLGARKFLAGFCMLALFAMVSFTVYTVYMRYVIQDPPVWGDTLTVLSNIWLVFIALALTVRERQHIALDLIYTRLPLTMGFSIQLMWTAIICLMGGVIAYYGWEVSANQGGKYWEMGYIAWEEGAFVLKENYMPKAYAQMILPLTGTLICIGALVAMIEDIFRFRAGTFVVSGSAGEV